MKKLISFSIWGNNPLYHNGMIQNIELISKFYPDFIPRIYCEKGIKLIDDLKYKSNIEIIIMDKINSWDGLFWRFRAIADADIILIRDTDSRINVREVAAVNEWLNSTYEFHGMRDHIEHNVPIMGGMFGCRNNFINILKLLSEWDIFNQKGADQNFLTQKVWPLVRDKSITHDRYHNGIKIDDYEYSPTKFFGEHHVVPFPNHPPMEGYVGEIIT